MISARDIAFIGCRFVAIYFAFKSLSMVAYILAALAGSGKYGPFYSLMIPFSLFLALSWAFWSGAGWLSERISRGATATDKKPHWSRDETVSLGVSLIGLVLLIFALARVPGLLANINIKGATPITFYIDVGIFIFASIFMIVKPTSIARLLIKIRLGGKQS